MLISLSLKYYLILGLLFLSIYARTIFPYAGLVTEGILITEIVVFLLIVFISLDFRSLFEFKLETSNKILLLLLLIAVFSFCYSFLFNLQYNMKISAISKTLSYFVVTILYVFIFSKKMFFDDDFFEFILSGLLIFGVISSLFSAGMLLLGIHPVPEYSSTSAGFYAHPNTTSFIFTIVTPILFYKYFTKKISIVTFSLLLILFSVCLLFTFSRAGYIGVFLGMLVFTFNKSKTIFLVTAILLIFVVTNLFLEFALSKTDSSLGRVLLIITAINMIMADSSSFLWGYGVYNFVEVFQSEKLFLGSVENVVDPHNLILLLGIQFGMVFTISVLLIIGIVIIKNFFSMGKNVSKEHKNKINLCLSIIMGLLVQNMLEDLVFYPEYFVMPIFMIFFGYLYYNIKPSINKKSNSES